MKKQISILLSLLVAFSSLFVSCSENDDDFKKPSNTGGGVTEHNGHAYVDLGLPSGIKWATCNVGATEPWEYGGYYAWGETEEKGFYGWETYKWCNGDAFSMTKYCADSRYGIVDNKMTLDPEDDVAHVKWGGDWRMPTKAELDELTTDCTWEWTTINGVEGHKVTGPNGNSIFLPAAGWYYEAEIRNRNGYGYYRSSVLEHHTMNQCYSLSLHDYWGCNVSYYQCDYGYSVRPVSK